MGELPVIHIIRETMDATATMGRLRVNGFECLTLELPWRDNAEDVSCIPAGTYKVKVTYSNKFKRDLPELLGVPGRSKVRIHPGNTTRDTQGCILVGGRLDREAREIEGGTSRPAMDGLNKALGPAREFWVNVRNPEEA